jgi:thiamine-monophosphate kinase
LSRSCRRCRQGPKPLLARRCQLAGGDDYELVFSAPVDRRDELAALAGELALPLWRCGRQHRCRRVS